MTISLYLKRGFRILTLEGLGLHAKIDPFPRYDRQTRLLSLSLITVWEEIGFSPALSLYDKVPINSAPADPVKQQQLTVIEVLLLHGGSLVPLLGCVDGLGGHDASAADGSSPTTTSSSKVSSIPASKVSSSSELSEADPKGRERLSTIRWRSQQTGRRGRQSQESGRRICRAIVGHWPLYKRLTLLSVLEAS